MELSLACPKIIEHAIPHKNLRPTSHPHYQSCLQVSDSFMATSFGVATLSIFQHK